MASFEFKDFRWSRAGYAELMDGAGIQGVVAEEADAIAERADAAMPKNGYTSAKHHKVADFQGKLAKGKVVYTRTRLAQYQQAQHKTLTESIGG